MGSTLTSRCHARRSTAPGRATLALAEEDETAPGRATLAPLVFLFRKNPFFYFIIILFLLIV